MLLLPAPMTYEEANKRIADYQARRKRMSYPESLAWAKNRGIEEEQETGILALIGEAQDNGK